MFKLESYITPFIMGYIDKYVKLKQEDFQLSLWGGDAVLNKLDLRLEAIEHALQLPIMFKSGHIHELRIHVPWSRLGSEPVVITINTIECVLKLRDNTGDSHSTASSSSAAQRTPQPRPRPRKPVAGVGEEQDLPPGYLQGYINKILNNANIVINNLILKFVEDDIVLSVNVKSAELYSVNAHWERDFVEISLPELVLRRAVNFHDLTVCLDKRNASGKIDTYQDPLLYRCSLSCRMHTTYDSPHAKFPAVTKVNVLCDKLELSLTDVQVPMFFRLVELCLALYYGSLEAAAAERDEVKASQIRGHLQTNVLGTDPPADPGAPPQGWSSWAWSYVPQILPEDEPDDYDWMDSGGPGAKPRKKEAAVFNLGLYCKKACVVFKLTELIQEHSSRFGPHKTTFKPCMRWEAEGIGVELLLKGLEYFSIQLGFTSSLVFSEGQAVCGVNDIDGSTRDPCFLRSGQIADQKPVHFLSYSLFDPDSAENQGDRPAFIVTWDRHMEMYTETYGIQKFGSLFVDYCYVMEKNHHSDDTGDDDSAASMTSEGEIIGARENSMMRFVVGPAHIVVSSSMVQRVHKFIHCMGSHEYEPYAKPRSDTPPDKRQPPTDEMIKKLEDYIPTRTYHFTLLRPSVLIQANDLPEYDVKKTRIISHRKAKKTRSKEQLHEAASAPALPGILIQADRFDLQVTSAMFPKKLVSNVSAMAAPSGNLLHHCHSHMYIKLFGLQGGLTYVNEKSQMTALHNILRPCSGAFYKTKLMLNKYWNNPLQTRSETMYEIPQVGVNATKAQVLLAAYVGSTWLQATPDPGAVLQTSLLNDVVYPQLRAEVPQPVLECIVGNIEVKQCYTQATSSVTGTLTSLHVAVLTQESTGVVSTSLLYGPQDTSKLHTTEYFSQSQPSLQNDYQVDLVMFTLQLPSNPSAPQAPGALFLDVQGIVGCLDPRLYDWLSYTPVKKGSAGIKPLSTPSRETQANAADDGQSSQLRGSESGSNQTNPTSGQTTSVSQSQSKSQGLAGGVGVPGAVDPGGEEPTAVAAPEEEARWGRWCAEKYPLIKMMEVQVDIQCVCVFLPSHPPPGPSAPPSSPLAPALRGLYAARRLPDTLALCVPAVRVYSQGHKCLPPVQELPIRGLETAIAGDKLPWSVEIKNASVYTILSSQSVNYICSPMNVCCSVAVNPTYCPPTSDNITSLGLALHADMKQITLAANNQQVQLIYDLISTQLQVASQFSASLAFMQKYFRGPGSPQENVNLSVIQQQPTSSYTVLAPSRSKSVPSASSQMELVEPMGGHMTESHDMIPTGATETTETGSQLSVTGLPSSEQAGSSGNPKLSLWLQWTLLKFVLKMYDKTNTEVKVCVDVEDMSTSVDMGNVYSKVNSKIGAVAASHYVRPSPGSHWQLGSYEGILMTKLDKITRNTQIVGNRLWEAGVNTGGATNLATSERSSVDQFDLEDVKPQDQGHSFVTFTFTRALKKNVKKRIQMNEDSSELLQNKMATEKGGLTKTSKGESGAAFLNEVILNVLPCDVVLNCPVLVCLLNVFKIDTSHGHLTQQKQFVDLNESFNSDQQHPAKEGRDEKTPSSIPYLTSANIPLLYINSNGVRIFIPTVTHSNSGKGSKVIERESSLLTLNDDSAIASYEKTEVVTTSPSAAGKVAEIPQQSASPGNASHDHQQAPAANTQSKHSREAEEKQQQPKAPTTKRRRKSSKDKPAVKQSKDDTFIIEMSSFAINPQPVNPLPRNIDNKELYRKGVQLGLLSMPGSELEDRQYQIDVCGWGLSSGEWKALIKREAETTENTQSQNPALEWNNMTRKWTTDAVELLPIAHSFDLRVTAAPAIVYHPSHQANMADKQPVLVCGYSLEMNATSDLDFYMSLNQGQLAHKIFLGNIYPLIWSLTQNAGAKDKNSDEKSTKNSPKHSTTTTSGIQSDFSTNQSSAFNSKQQVVMETIEEDRRLGVGEQRHDVTMDSIGGEGGLGEDVDASVLGDRLTPFDVLLTAGRISMMVYRHTDNSECMLSKSLTTEMMAGVARKKSDLEWKKDSVWENASGKEELRRVRSVDDNSSTTLDSGLPAEKDDIPTPARHNKKIVPVLYAYFSQPHSLVSVLRHKQKIELSCYDLVLKGGRVGKDEQKLIPEPSDFPTHWIETKPGKPDSKTGILPSLYTLRVTDFLFKPAKIVLDIDRPVKVNLSLSKLEQITQLAEEVWRDIRHSFPKQATHTQADKETDKISGDKEASSADVMKQLSHRLTSVAEIHLHTEQLLLVCDAAYQKNSPKVELSTSGVDANVFFVPFTHKALISEVDSSISMKDIYMTTSLQNKCRPLIGPFTSHVTGNASWCMHSGSEHLPKVTLVVKTGVIQVQLGQGHVICLMEIVDYFGGLIQKTYKKWQPNVPTSDATTTPSKQGRTRRETKSPALGTTPDRPRWREGRREEQPQVEVSEDDLRSGALEYVTLETNIEELPCEGEILFSNNFSRGIAGVSWCYREPRGVTRLSSAPMPLNLPLEMEAERVDQQLMVPCLLQYWDSLTETYECYAEFTVSEHKACDLVLPEVTNHNRDDVLAARIWRVLISRPEERGRSDGYVLLDKYSEAGSAVTEHTEDDEFVLVNKRDERFIEPLVSPLTLAASLKVTSCFSRHLVPVFQVAILSEQVLVRMFNHMSHVGHVTPNKLAPFELCEDAVESHEVMVLRVDDPSLTFYHYQGQQQCVECEVSGDLSMDVLEYGHLTLLPVTDRVQMDGEIQWTKQGDRQKVKANVFVEPCALRAGPSVVHSLGVMVDCWGQLHNKTHYPVAHHYIICNDTQETVRLGQVDTDEGLVVKSRQALPYAWRTSRSKPLLRICLERLAWQWCEGVTIDTDTTHTRHIIGKQHRVTLIVHVRKITHIHTQITIQGNYFISSRVTHPLDIKLLTTHGGKDKIVTLASEGTLPSYVLDPQEVKGLKVRLAGQNVLWSQEISVSGESMKTTSKMLKIPSEECTSFMHVWCHLFEQKQEKCSQYMILLAPIFVFRSQLPAPLLMTVDTPRIKTYSPLEVEGHNLDTQIHTMGGDMTHNITFQLSNNMKPSKPAIQLSSGMIEQVSTEKLEQVLVNKMAYDWRDAHTLLWPYNHKEITGMSPVTQPNTPVVPASPSAAGTSAATQHQISLSQQRLHSLGGGGTPSLGQPGAQAMRKTATGGGYTGGEESQPNIDLQVSLSQYWAGCNTLLVDIAPHLLLSNECSLDLWVIANGETHWKLPADQTWAPPPFEGSFRLGLVIDHELQLSEQLELSSEDDRARYLPKVDGLLYIEGHITVHIPIKHPDSGVVNKMCYLTLHSTKHKNMRIVTVKERFAVANQTARDMHVTMCDVPLTPHKATVDFRNTSSVTLPSRSNSTKAKHKSDNPESHAVLFWDVLYPPANPSADNMDQLDSSEHVQYLLLQCDITNNQSTNSSQKQLPFNKAPSTSSVFEMDQSDSCLEPVANPLLWSCPIRMKVNVAESANRQNVSIPVIGVSGEIVSYMCTAVTKTVDAVSYVVISEEYYPQIQIENNCDFSMHIGQTFVEKTSEDVTVYEEVELINKLPVLPSHATTQYTFPAVNTQFSQLADYDLTTLKLHFTACDDLGEQIQALCSDGSDRESSPWRRNSSMGGDVFGGGGSVSVSRSGSVERDVISPPPPKSSEEVLGDISTPRRQSSPGARSSAGSVSMVTQQTGACCHRNRLRWSVGVDVTQGSDCCVYLPGVSDVKVHIEKVGHTTYLYLDPVSRAEISAKEIRSRIKGGEQKTVIIETNPRSVSSKSAKDVMSESLIEFERHAEVIQADSISCTDTNMGVLVDNIDANGKNSRPKSSTSRNKHNRKKSTSSATSYQQPETPSIHIPIEFECNFLCKQASVILLDERQGEICEALRVTMDHVCGFVCPETDILQLTYQRPHASYRCLCYVGDIQVDNQMKKDGNYDFPVVLLKKEDFQAIAIEKDFVELTKHEKIEILTKRGFICVNLGLCSDSFTKNITIETIGVLFAPVKLFIEDTFIYDVLKKIDHLMPVAMNRVSNKPIRGQLPKSVKGTVCEHSRPIRLGKITVEPINMDLSVHASLKLFLASDNSPLKFGRFERGDVFVSSSQLVRLITMHYASAALFRAGWVVGSLELIGSPTGLVRSIGTGVSDLFKMPYQGLTIGPGAFVGGLTRGFGSLLRNLSSGTLTSVTNFASSVSRNMDRLSLDSDHQQRQEVYRRQVPQGVGDGLMHGLTGFGLSLLGAVAGLADQPLQTLTREDRGASGLMTGVGRGLVGIVTKPVGGAAELVSQTGMGLLQSSGLAKHPTPRMEGTKWPRGRLGSGALKVVSKLVELGGSHSVCVLSGTQNLHGAGLVPSVLVLTSHLLHIVDCGEDCQQQAFSITEIELTKSKNKSSLLYIGVKSAVAEARLEKDHKLNPESDERIQAFVKNVSKTTKQQQQPAAATDLFSLVSDSQSEASNSITAGALSGSSFMYEFYVDKKLRNLFYDVYRINKARLAGVGFPV